MNSGKFRLTAGIISACLGVLALGGCPAVDQAPQEAEQTASDKDFVGRMQEMDALVGIVMEDDQVMAYICDAVEGGESRSGWYEGLVVDGEIEMAPVIGTTYQGTGFGSKIVATLSDDIVDGALELEDGTRLSFVATLVDSESSAGLYAEQDEDDDALISVIVSEDGEAKGLSRFRRTGWTSRVTLRRPPPSRGGRISVNLKRSNGSLRRRDLVRRRRLPILRPVIKPKPAPAPTGGLGTLMILTSVKTLGLNVKVDGYLRKEVRPDPIGVPTIKLSAQFADPNAAKRIPMGLMRVRVIDATGKVLSTQIIDDPLHGFLEVPKGLKGEEAFWTRDEQRIESFLVAVPNIKEARRVLFTRYTSKGYARHAGVLDLKKDPVKKPFLREQVTGTVYFLDQAEYNTVVNNGLPEQRFDLLILAEGYQDTPEQKDKFNQDVTNVIEGLWTIPIYAEFQAVINVHTAFIGSVDSGPSTQGGDDPVNKDTVYQSFFDYNLLADGRMIRLTGNGNTRARIVASYAPAGNYGEGGLDGIVVLVNDPTWAGSAGRANVVTITAYQPQTPNDAEPTILAHELGHAAAGLGDEYESLYNDEAIAHALTTPNVSGPVENRNALKWIDLVLPGTAIPTQTNNGFCIPSTLSLPPFLEEGTVGMFEGAGYAACDSFRPLTACRMRDSEDEFCPVCRKEIRDALEPFAGIQPDPNPDPDPDPDPNAPTHDIYVRDNSLDVGNVPSPHNVADPASGSTAWVKIWNSVDIRVDAPPFDESGNGAHENPVAGTENHVFVTVHNRGTKAGSAATQVSLYYTVTVGPGPEFPFGWTFIDSQGIQVPAGPNGEARVRFDWETFADLPPHVCVIATVSTDGDEAPPQSDGRIFDFNRDNNNVTQKNLHVVKTPEIAGDIANFKRAIVPIVFWIEAPEVPLGTVFDLTYQTNISMVEFEDGDLRQMDVGIAQAGRFTFTRTNTTQRFFLMQTDLPQGDPDVPFTSAFVLKVILPGGTPAGETYEIFIDQVSFDHESELYGDSIGGNTYTYTVGFD